MGEYYGTEQAIALQKSLRARAAQIAADPLLANGGRILNVLDAEAYGWDALRRDVEQDGYIALTMIHREVAANQLADVFDKNADFPSWEAFTGAPGDILPVCEDVVAGAELPSGWRVESYLTPTNDVIDGAQTLNQSAGVAPTPAYYLRGEVAPSLLTCIWDEAGALAACASATMRYHADGPLGGWIFAGGVSVGDQHRRRGLGSLVNARLLIDSHVAFGWTTVLEQARADNHASVGMITRCGLTLDPDRITVVVNMTGGQVTR